MNRFANQPQFMNMIWHSKPDQKIQKSTHKVVKSLYIYIIVIYCTTVPNLLYEFYIEGFV